MTFASLHEQLFFDAVLVRDSGDRGLIGLSQDLRHLVVRESALSHFALRTGCRRGRFSCLNWSEKLRAGQ